MESLEQARSIGDTFLGDVYWDDDSKAIFGKASGEADQDYLTIYSDKTNHLQVFDSAKDGAGTVRPLSFQMGGAEIARFLATGEFCVGDTSPSLSGPEFQVIWARHDQDGHTECSVVNATDGTSALASLALRSGVSRVGEFVMTAPSFTPGGGFEADSLSISSLDIANGINIMTREDVPIKFKINATLSGRFKGVGHFDVLNFGAESSGAYAGMQILQGPGGDSGTRRVELDVLSSSFGSTGLYQAGETIIVTTGCSALSLGTNDNHPVKISANSVEGLLLTGSHEIVQAAPASVPADGTLFNGSISFSIDESGNKLDCKVKYSGGTVKNLLVPLTLT